MGVTDGYGALARVYDAFNSTVNYTSWADFAEKCFDRFLPCRPSLVLDLACGTGTLTSELSRRGYDMTGVDLSPDMLAAAREVCPPDTLLLCQNMTGFELYGTVGATVCSLDSLNHLTRQGDILRCFKTVHNYLDPDGLFIFDINSPHRFTDEYGQNSYQYSNTDADGRDAFCNWQNDFSPKTGLCRFYVTLFTENASGTGSYSREDVSWSERMYTREEIEHALADAGFKTCGVWGTPGMRSPRATDKKLYFAARAKK